MKKLLSVLLAMVLVLSLGVAGVAAEGDAALSVYTQTGAGEAVLAKSYTAAELDALKDAGTSVYVYSGKSGASAVVATEYVTLDALLADAGVTFAEEDSLSFTCDDGPYSKWTPTYADLAERGVDDQGNAVPTAFALTWDSGALEDGAAAIAANAKNTGNIRFVCGMTEEEAADNSGRGMRMPSGVVSVTVVTPKPTAGASAHKLVVDGEEKSAEFYLINDENYFKVRDIAMLLNGSAAQFGVGWDDGSKTVAITRGTAYESVGNELTLGKSDTSTVALSRDKLLIDGAETALRVYKIDGYNYFRLKDLGPALGFNVGWDGAIRSVLVTTR